MTDVSHKSVLPEWTTGEVRRRLDATIAYLESDPEWVVGPSVVAMYRGELERRGAAE